MKLVSEVQKKITVDILGDICLAWYSQDLKSALHTAKLINNVFGKANYRIANLEAPFLCDEDLSPSCKENSNSNLGVEKKYIEFIKMLDIDAFTLANNHLGDFGEQGIRDTIHALESLNREYVGSSLIYKDTYKPLRVQIGDYNLSFISVCENEFGIAGQGRIGAAGYNPLIMKKLLKKEGEWADFKIIIFHGGTEHYPFPTPKQKQRYHWLVDLGAEIVVGMHQHCPVGYENYKSSLIIYGLGNFFFPRKSAILYENWNVGYLARLILGTGKNIDFQTLPFIFDNEGKGFCGICQKDFEEYYTDISNLIENDDQLEQLYKGWLFDSGVRHYDILKYCLDNSDNVYSFNIVKNLFSCEAHNELLTAYLNLRYYEPETDYLEYFKIVQKYINIRHYGGMVHIKKKDKERKKYVLWGVGSKAEDMYKRLNDHDSEIFIIDKDCHKQGFYLYDSKVEAPEDVISKNIDAIYYICTSKAHRKDIKRYLTSAGIPEKNIIGI